MVEKPCELSTRDEIPSGDYNEKENDYPTQEYELPDMDLLLSSSMNQNSKILLCLIYGCYIYSLDEPLDPGVKAMMPAWPFVHLHLMGMVSFGRWKLALAMLRLRKTPCRLLCPTTRTISLGLCQHRFFGWMYCCKIMSQVIPPVPSEKRCLPAFQLGSWDVDTSYWEWQWCWSLWWPRPSIALTWLQKALQNVEDQTWVPV